MRLLINTATTFKGGGVQVAKSFIEECMHFGEHEYFVILGEGLSKLIDVKKFTPNFHFYHIPYRPATRVFSIQRPERFFEDLEKIIQPDCVFTTSGPSYWRPQAPHLMGYNLAHHLYPDSPFFRQLTTYKWVYWKLKARVIKYYTKHDADAYVTQTDDINHRLRAWIKTDKVATVMNTYGSHFKGPMDNADRLLPKKASGEYRFLMLSAWYRHKNFEIINPVSELLQQREIADVRFVLTLPTDTYDQLFTPTARKYSYNIGPVTPQQCPALYDECDAVFLPTLLECFSATYAEAMVMQKPVVTSDMDFAHTVCADAALYFDPMNASDIVEKIVMLKGSEPLQHELVNKGKVRLSNFNSARERARKYLELCVDLAKQK